MKIIRGIQNIKESITYPVLTIGNFDGVHLGHQAIFKKVVDRVKEVEGTGIVFTFEPHPKKINAAVSKMSNGEKYVCIGGQRNWFT